MVKTFLPQVNNPYTLCCLYEKNSENRILGKKYENEKNSSGKKQTRKSVELAVQSSIRA